MPKVEIASVLPHLIWDEIGIADMSESLATEIRHIARKAHNHGDRLQTEEATKNALIMPFLQALGYNIFDPNIVIPEFTADHGIKKGEKVDYAITIDGTVQILIECKTFSSDLNIHNESQLYRYFAVTSARFAILTNGREYRFYSDLDEANKLDAIPFFIFDIETENETDIWELSKFCYENFSVDKVLVTAQDLKYRSALEKELAKEFQQPSDEFFELFARRVYPGRLTSTVKDWLRSLFDQSLQQTFRDYVSRRVSEAMRQTDKSSETKQDQPEDEHGEAQETEIVTTEEEMQAFQIIRAILRKYVDVNRITMRDQKSYCSILLDNNNRKPICRLHFNAKKKKRIGVFINKEETRYDIAALDDIFGVADELSKAVQSYDSAEA